MAGGNNDSPIDVGDVPWRRGPVGGPQPDLELMMFGLRWLKIYSTP